MQEFKVKFTKSKQMSNFMEEVAAISTPDCSSDDIVQYNN